MGLGGISKASRQGALGRHLDSTTVVSLGKNIKKDKGSPAGIVYPWPFAVVLFFKKLLAPFHSSPSPPFRSCHSSNAGYPIL